MVPPGKVMAEGTSCVVGELEAEADGLLLDSTAAVSSCFRPALDVPPFAP